MNAYMCVVCRHTWTRVCRPEHDPKLTPLALSSSFKSTPILSLELNKQAKLTGREPQTPTCLQSPGAGLPSCPDTQWLLHKKSPSPGGHLCPQFNMPQLGDFRAGWNVPFSSLLLYQLLSPVDNVKSSGHRWPRERDQGRAWSQCETRASVSL